jgi:uncharacterized membrane protein YGL010W
MALSLLIVVAVAIPLLFIAGLVLFSKFAIWGSVNPHVAGPILMTFAIFPVTLGIMELRDGSSVAGLFFLLGGVLHLVTGWGYRRQPPISIE